MHLLKELLHGNPQSGLALVLAHQRGRGFSDEEHKQLFETSDEECIKQINHTLSDLDKQALINLYEDVIHALVEERPTDF